MLIHDVNTNALLFEKPWDALSHVVVMLTAHGHFHVTTYGLFCLLH